MNDHIKKIWVNDQRGFISLTFESADPAFPHLRVHAFGDALFPADPTPEKPLRHTMQVGPFY
jgi:hypothetical protein